MERDTDKQSHCDDMNSPIKVRNPFLTAESEHFILMWTEWKNVFAHQAAAKPLKHTYWALLDLIQSSLFSSSIQQEAREMNRPFVSLSLGADQVTHCFNDVSQNN